MGQEEGGASRVLFQAEFSISLQCAALLLGTDPNFPRMQDPI